jgi:uncharacterized protein (TIGR00255 family)
MTGFGRRDLEIEGVSVSIEVRSVNHRHLDVSVRLPRLLAGLEGPLKKRLQSSFSRGKVDATIAFGQNSMPRARLELDREVVAQYRAFAAELAGDAAPVDLPVDRLIALPGVARLVEQELSPDRAGPALETALAAAAADVSAMRELEGEALEGDLRGRLARVAGLVDSLAERSEEVVLAARERLRKRSDQLREETGLLDEARLHQEVVIAADRLDVSEELTRLRSHVEQFAGVLAADSEEPCGRRLDFLLQEMMREANTIGSKAGDAARAHRVVDLKTELERIREQVQNVE